MCGLKRGFLALLSAILLVGCSAAVDDSPSVSPATQPTPSPTKTPRSADEFDYPLYIWMLQVNLDTSYSEMAEMYEWRSSIQGGGVNPDVQFEPFFPPGYLTEYPETQLVRVITLEEWAQVHAECMNEGGWSTYVIPGNGVAEREEITAEMLPAYNLSWYTCTAQYPVDDPQYYSLG